MTTGKTIALTRWTFVGKVISLLFNMLSRLVITFFLRGKHLLISWLQSPSAVILEPKINKASPKLTTQSRFVIAFLPRSNHVQISRLQSPSAVILEPKKRKSVTTSTFSPSICHVVMGPDAMILVF